MALPEREIRDQIEALLIDYCHTLDDAHWDDWPEFFTPNGDYRIVTRENHEAGMSLGLMSCIGQGMMKDRMLALQTANVFEPHTYCHTINRPSVQIAQNAISARTNFTVVRTMQSGQMELFAAGKYLDRIEQVGEQWRFRERLVVLESRRIDILLVAPL